MTIEVHDLSKEYKTPAGTVHALKSASFSVPTGSFASIIGKSGSGKSTLLSLLGTLDTPTTGTIRVDDTEVTKLNRQQQTTYRARQIGFIFQKYELIPNLTARENVLLALEFGGTPRPEDRADALLGQVGIDSQQRNRRPSHLSGGQQQRVSIARALANHPSLVLADEPTGNLDSESSDKIFNLLKELSHTEQATIIAVTHDLDLASKTDQTFQIRNGVLAEQAAAVR